MGESEPRHDRELLQKRAETKKFLIEHFPQITDVEAYLNLLDADCEDFADPDNLPIGLPVLWLGRDQAQAHTMTIKEVLNADDDGFRRYRVVTENELMYNDSDAITTSKVIFPLTHGKNFLPLVALRNEATDWEMIPKVQMKRGGK